MNRIAAHAGLEVRETAPVERVLFVCTGNLCRSPMAEAFTRAFLAGRPHEVSVASAGLLQPTMVSPAEVLAAMARRQVDLSRHRPRRLPDDFEVEPDLVIGMAREHVRALVERDPAFYFPRSFTLKSLVGRAGTLGPRPPGAPLATYLAALGQGRDFRELAGMSTLDEVADPIGRGRAAFERAAGEIGTLCGALVDCLWPAAVP